MDQKVGSQAREGSKVSCYLKPKSFPELFGEETRDRHHSRPERRKHVGSLRLELHLSDYSNRCNF